MQTYDGHYIKGQQHNDREKSLNLMSQSIFSLFDRRRVCFWTGLSCLYSNMGRFPPKIIFKLMCVCVYVHLTTNNLVLKMNSFVHYFCIVISDGTLFLSATEPTNLLPLPSCLLIQLPKESSQCSLFTDSSCQYFFGHGKQLSAECGVQSGRRRSLLSQRLCSRV